MQASVGNGILSCPPVTHERSSSCREASSASGAGNWKIIVPMADRSRADGKAPLGMAAPEKASRYYSVDSRLRKTRLTPQRNACSVSMRHSTTTGAANPIEMGEKWAQLKWSWPGSIQVAEWAQSISASKALHVLPRIDL